MIRELSHIFITINRCGRFYGYDYKTINWNNDEYALGAFAWYAPGQNQLFAYHSYLPEFNNKVFFAGEHISPYHAWMQGALQTGMVAANNIAYMLKTKR